MKIAQEDKNLNLNRLFVLEVCLLLVLKGDSVNEIEAKNIKEKSYKCIKIDYNSRETQKTEGIM